MQKLIFHTTTNSSSKTYLNSLSVNPKMIRQSNTSIYDSIKKINIHEYNKRKSNFKSTLGTETVIDLRKGSNYDFVNQRSSLDNDQDETRDMISSNRENHNIGIAKSKGVRFRDRVSIDQQRQLREQQRQSLMSKKGKIFNDITNDKTQLSDIISQNKYFSLLPMTSRRRAPQNIKIVSDLLNSPIQSKGTIINQLKCFMCHYPQQNSVFFLKRVINIAKEKLIQVDKLQTDVFFRYDAFGSFLKILSQSNYDSHQVIAAYQTLINKYTYPVSIKLMLYYLGSFLYQLNNMYDKSQSILKKLLNQQLFKFKLYEYIGIYLLLMVKMKSKILQWQICTKYLMKLLAYSWLYKLRDLEIWVYFQLSRAYFFLNLVEESHYFKIRSQMSIIQPVNSLYREIISRQFKQQIQFMRAEHKFFSFGKQISICQLVKILQPKKANHIYEDQRQKDTFKLQSQIKSINQECKIKHVKNLLSRMNSSGACYNQTSRSINTASRNISHQYVNDSKSGYKTNRNQVGGFAGNPLLRTHQSGLKNLNVYFRGNAKGENRKKYQPKMYTFQNSSKNLLVLKEICRNILLQMKWFIPVNVVDA